MKKLISSVVLCTLLASASLSVFAEDMLIAPSPAQSYTVIADNKPVDLKSNTVYKSGNHIMIPLRAVAEALGFNVRWDEEKSGVYLDNGEVNTTLYIGVDSYYMASSTAIGMSAPTGLGAAPELKGDTTYAPADVFNILYCGNVVSEKDGTVTIKKTADDSVQIPNPFTEYKTIESAKSKLSFNAPVPTALPGGYTPDYIAVMGNDFLQISYKNGDNEIFYRTAKGSDDISGDYNLYNDIKTVKIGDIEVTVRRSEKTLSAVWTNNDLTFSLYSNTALTDKDLSDIISNIK